MRSMRKRSKLLSTVLVLSMMVTLLASFSTVTASTEPTVLDYSSGGLVRFGSGYVDSTVGGKFESVTDADAPVEQAFMVKGADSSTATTGGGIRGTGDGLFKVAEANSLLAVSYYVKAVNTSNTPQIQGNLQYTTSTAGGGDAVYDTDSTKVIDVANDTWIHRVQYFNVKNPTEYDDTNKRYYLRFVLSCAVPGQSTYLGGLTVYNFGADFTYGDKSGKEAAEAYFAYINRDFNVSLIDENYDLGCWGMSGSPYYGSPYPKIIDVERQSFSKAIRFWGNDVKIKEKNEENGKNNVNLYRGQLAPQYLAEPESISKGDKIFISFWAKAYNNYGTECILQPYMDAVTSANASAGYAIYGTSFTLNDSWQYYSTIVNIDKSFEEITASSGKEAATYRVCLSLGTLGQVTDFADFRVYRCDGTQSDKEILKALDEQIANKDLFTGTVDSFGNSTTQSTSSSAVKITVSDATVPFTEAKKIVSLNEQHQLRVRPAYITDDEISANDMLVMSFWAKGWKGEDGSTTGDAIAIRPRFTKVVSGSFGTDYQPVDNSGSEFSDVTLTDTWKRYAVVFKVSSDFADWTQDDTSGLGIRIFVNTGSGNTAENRVIYLADMSIYNLGQISAEEAYSQLGDASLKEIFLQTRSAVKNADGTYTAYASSDTVSVAMEDISGLAVNSMSEAYCISEPSGIGGSGTIRIAAPNGTTNDYSFDVQKLALLEQKSVDYSQNGKAQVVLRCDDLYPRTNTGAVNADGQHSMDSFKWVLEETQKRDMKVSFGVVGNEWENASEEDWNTIKQWQDDYGVEFWHHGYNHDSDAYSADIKGEYGLGVPQSYQLEVFTKTWNLFNDHGIKLSTFAAPFNATSVVTSRMLNEFNSTHENAITVISFPTRQDAVFEGLIMSNRVNLEDTAGTSLSTGTGLCQYDSFLNNLANSSYDDYFIVQTHPTLFDTIDSVTGKNDFNEYEKMLDYLVANGYSTTTHREYAALAKNPSSSLTALPAGIITANINLYAGQPEQKVSVIYALYDNENSLKDCSISNVYLTPFTDNKINTTLIGIPEEHSGYYTRLYVWDMENGMKPLIKNDNRLQ